jgi:hypothetical protein
LRIHWKAVISSSADPKAGGVPRPRREAAAAVRRLGPPLLAVGSIALVALAVLGAEGLARWLEPDYLVSTRGLHVFSPIYGWTPRREASREVDGRTVSLNARGHRGHLLPPAKALGSQRLIVLGDSIAFGLGVSDEETFAYLIGVQDNGIEAGNLAVQGYGPGQELLLLAQEGLGYGADDVVLAFCLANDFADAVLPVALYDGRSPKPRFRLIGDRLVLDDASLRPAPPWRLLQWLGDYSHLFNRVLPIGSGEDTPAGLHWRGRKHEALRDEDYALRLNLALVRRMNALCRERGVAFHVAVFPTEHTWKAQPWLAATLISSLESDGIAVVDMAARFRGRGLSFETIALDGLGHLSPAGHLAASQIIESEIARPSPAPSPRP